MLWLKSKVTKFVYTKYLNWVSTYHKNYSLIELLTTLNIINNNKKIIITAREFLERSMKSGSKQSSAEMKSLCLGLFEAMNDKSIALQHHRKTNQ